MNNTQDTKENIKKIPLLNKSKNFTRIQIKALPKRLKKIDAKLLKNYAKQNINGIKQKKNQMLQ